MVNSISWPQRLFVELIRHAMRPFHRPFPIIFDVKKAIAIGMTLSLPQPTGGRLFYLAGKSGLGILRFRATGRMVSLNKTPGPSPIVNGFDLLTTTALAGSQ